MNICLSLSEVLFENKSKVPDGFYIKFMDLLKKQYHNGDYETELFNYVGSQAGIVDSDLLIKIYKILLEHVNTKIKTEAKKIMPYNDLIVDLCIIMIAFGALLAKYFKVT